MLTEDQIKFLNEVCPDRWTEKNDVIKVKGSLNMSAKRLTQIPIQFGQIYGFFDCAFNKLSTAKGMPFTIFGYFSCSYNNLTSLEGGPEYVDIYYACSNNQLLNLIGSVKTCYNNFNCCNNILTSLEGCPRKIKGNLECRNNPNLNILYGIGHVEGKIYYDNQNDLNEWIIEQAQKNIFVSYTDIAKWIKRNNKLEFLLHAQSEIRQHFSPRILHLVDSGIYNESKILDYKNFKKLC